jgi:hypothetical protein
MMSKVIGWFGKWWRKLFAAHVNTYNEVVIVDSLEQAEKVATSRKMAVVRKATYDKWLLFNCPSGCGEVIHLNLMSSAYPHWHYRRDRTGISIYPSVIVTTCRSHFWVRNGQVDWCSD